jgi:hypothetical protein
MGKSQSTRSKTPPSAALSTTNPNLTILGSLLGLRSATNHLGLPQISPVPMLYQTVTLNSNFHSTKDVVNNEDTEKCCSSRNTGVKHEYNCVCYNDASPFQVYSPGSPATVIYIPDFKLRN